MEANKNGIGAAVLVKKYFGCESKEIMALSGAERIQLGSAVARQEGIQPEALSFIPVEY